MSQGRRMGCSRRKGNARGVDGDALRKRNLLEAIETGFSEY